MRGARGSALSSSKESEVLSRVGLGADEKSLISEYQTEIVRQEMASAVVGGGGSGALVSVSSSSGAGDLEPPGAKGGPVVTSQDGAEVGLAGNALSQPASALYPPEINCVFAFLHLRIKLDLVKIVTRIRNAEYNPKRFHAVVLRIRQPKATAVIYASGKLVCMGSKNEAAARTACRKFVRVLQKVGYPEARFAPTEEEPLIRNIMAKSKVPFPIRLEDFARAHNDFVSFEPEIFPALIYRMARPRVTIFVFVTGTVLITGAKTRSDVTDSFDAIYPVLHGYKKDPEPQTATATPATGAPAAPPIAQGA